MSQKADRLGPLSLIVVIHPTYIGPVHSQTGPVVVIHKTWKHEKRIRHQAEQHHKKNMTDPELASCA